MAELLAAFWDWHCWPPEYGTVVIFSRLAIDSRLDVGRNALVRLGEFLQVEFGRRASVLLLKAFPLEFENSVTTKNDRQLALDRRSQAMFRLYERSLLVRPFPTNLFDQAGCGGRSDIVRIRFRPRICAGGRSEHSRSGQTAPRIVPYDRMPVASDSCAEVREVESRSVLFQDQHPETASLMERRLTIDDGQRVAESRRSVSLTEIALFRGRKEAI